MASPTVGRVAGEYDGHRTGDHRRDGLLLAEGPDAAGWRDGAIDSVDIAPTILSILESPMGDPEGRPLGFAVGGAIEG